MKKHILVYIFFSLFFGFFLSYDLYAQYEHLEVDYEVEETLVSDSVRYNLKVSVNSSSGELVYVLFSPIPDIKYLLEESSPTTESSYVFNNLKEGRYIVLIKGEDKGGIKIIQLGNIKTNDQ